MSAASVASDAGAVTPLTAETEASITRVENTAHVLKIAFGGASTKGAKQRNEDAFAACLPAVHIRHMKGAAACVADGVSCSDNAQLASETSVTTFIQDYLSTPESWDVKTAAARVLSALNSWLYYQGQVALSRHNSLVTTFTGAIFKSTTAHIFHTGDSRIYRLRQGELVQLTSDHNLVQHNGETILTRALGMENLLKVDYQQRSIRKDDIFLLTTDGLHGFLSHADIQSHLSPLTGRTDWSAGAGQDRFLENLARELTGQALARGSDDNLTCLIVKVIDVPLEDIDEAHRKLTKLVIPPAMQPGVTLDGYTITRILHSGARSHIYMAEHPRFREPFVIKVPSVNFAEDPAYLEGFIREQWVGRRIDDPLVMKIHDPVPGSKFLYHICEYIPGTTLRQWIYDNPQPELSEVRRLGEQVAAGLRIFQRMGMLHRDLKPENIMVLPDGTIKLIDFGTVKVSGLEEIASPVKDDTPVGSVDYIAPEYLMGEAGMHRADIFSLGVILYEMITGRLPYKTRLEKTSQVSSFDHWQYEAAQTHRRDVPLWLDLALRKACAPRPSQRYQALSEFMHDMSTPNQALLEQHTASPLLEKDPLKFWQVVSAILLFTVILQLVWPYL